MVLLSTVPKTTPMTAKIKIKRKHLQGEAFVEIQILN
jgi:hypothetical protein